MREEGSEESVEPLIEQRLAREGFTLKLDRGFEEGSYCVYVHFDELASRLGYAAAHRRAEEYCNLLRAQLERFAGHAVGETEEASTVGRTRRRKEEDFHYVAFPVAMSDGRYRDATMKKEFQLAVVRAGQQSEQEQARVDTQRLEARRDAFRLRLRDLLAGEPYQQVDKPTKDLLLEEVPMLAFPARGIEL